MMKLALTFLAGSAMPKILVFALLPLYTRYLPPQDFGYYDVSITYVTIVMSVLFMDVWVATMRFMYKTDARDGKQSAVRAGITLFAVSSTLLCLTAGIVGVAFDVRYLWLILAYGLTTNLKEFYGFVARGYDKNVPFTLSGAANTAVMVALNLLMLLVLDLDFSALYIASIVGNLVQCVWLESATKVRSALRHAQFDKQDVLNMAHFALPLGVNSVAYWLMTGFGKIVVQHEMSLTDNGYFALGSRFSTLIVVASGIVTMAWQDVSFARGADDRNDFYRRASAFFLVFTGFGLAVLLPAISIGFRFIVGPAYEPAYPLIPLFVTVAALGAYSTLIGNIFYALHKTGIVFYSTLASCLVSLGLCVPFVQWWGINGANLAVAIAFIVNIIFRSTVLARLVSFGFNGRDLLLVVSLVAGSVVTYQTANVALNLGYAVAVLCIFVVIYMRQLRVVLRK